MSPEVQKQLLRALEEARHVIGDAQGRITRDNEISDPSDKGSITFVLHAISKVTYVAMPHINEAIDKLGSS